MGTASDAQGRLGERRSTPLWVQGKSINSTANASPRHQDGGLKASKLPRACSAYKKMGRRECRPLLTRLLFGYVRTRHHSVMNSVGTGSLLLKAG